MKKKSIVLMMSLFLVCLLVGCAESDSTASGIAEPTPEEVSMGSNQPTDSVESTMTEATEPEPDQPAEIEQELEQQYVKVIGDRVRIRSSASTETNDNIVKMSAKGEKYIKIGDEGDWSKISVDGGEGFIKTEYVEMISKEEFESVKETATSAQTEETTPPQPAAQENNEALLAQQQEALLAQQQQALLAQQQQQALLAQQQQEALLAQQQQAAAQQQAAVANSSGGGYGTWENTQMRSDRIVYITPSGKKYHYDQECAGKNAIPRNLDDVIGSHGPCGTCVLK